MKDKIVNALKGFMNDDRCLLEVEANERSITHRFAIHIEKEFPEYHVDCEYNRDGHEPKRLDRFVKKVDSDNHRGVTIFPDVIVHKRNTTTNLVVVEAKTSANNSGCQLDDGCRCDCCKLKAIKEELGYKYAFFIVFPVGGELASYSEEKIDGYITEV